MDGIADLNDQRAGLDASMSSGGRSHHQSRRALTSSVARAKVELSQKEREIPVLLLRARRRVLSREVILNAGWSQHEDPLTNAVDVGRG